MAVPYTFGSATSSIPLSQLDSNFATTITLGNTAIQLGNTVTTLNNMTLANVTVTTVSGASANAVVYTNSSGQVTANSSVIALDTSGNLGLGVTPSAWSATYKALQVGGSVGLWGGASTELAILSSNAYLGGSGYARIIAGYATRYSQNVGTHTWSTAATSTAGSAITWTDVMTLDASGNLGIGKSSPGTRLDVDSGSTAIVANFNSTNANGLYLRFQNSGTSIGDIGSGANLFSGGTVGDFGISSRSGNLVFGTSSTERARIDSSGNFLVGTTSFTAATNANFMIYGGGSEFIGHASGTASGTQYLDFRYNGSAIGTITQNGTTAVAYNTTSDYRLKENVQPLSGALARVAALKPCTYTWKSAPDEIGEGFIAHELAEVCPQAVTGEKDAVDEEGNAKYQSIDTSFLVATLTAAIKEQQTIIEQLQADVAALKGTK